MKKSLFFAIVGFVAAVCLPVSPARAAQWDITVPDASFEDHVLSLNGYEYIGAGGYTGAWESHSGDAWVDYLYWAANGWPEDLPAHTGNNKDPDSDYIYQILDETLIEGGTYTLKVWAGQPWAGDPSGWWLYFTSEDYEDNLIEGSGSAGLDWGQVSLAYTATAADAGNKFGIKIWSNAEVSFDDVTLSYDGPGGNLRATNPIPADGSRTLASGPEGDGYYMLMTFTAGYGATTHTAYFSSNFDDVNDRNPAVRLGSPPYPDQPGYETAYYAGLDDPGVPEFARTPLERGVTYYWVVDESNDTASYPGHVWSYTIASDSAWLPTPVHDGQYINGASVALSWQLGDITNPGDYIISYDVYWGTDEAAVAAGTSDTINVSDPTHIIGPLSGDTDYYWKVDTVLTLKTPPNPITIIDGSIWRFKTILTVPIVDEDLVGWWKLDGDIGPGMAFDSSGYANHGTLHGDPEYVPGHVDNALDCDGTGDYVDCGNSTVLNQITANVTVAAWIQVRTFDTTWQAILTKGDNSWRIHRGSSSNNINFAISGHNPLSITGTTNVNDGEWHHVAGVYDGAGKVLYVDGQVEASDTATGAIPVSTYNVNIGENSQQTGRHWSGLIDDARIYKRALSAKDIQILAGLLSASDPDPGNGATDVARTPTLSWTPGVFAAAVNGNILYYGEDLSAVMARTATRVPLTEATYELPMTLDLGATFYWVVDTINGVEDDSPWEGDVWSFTTVDWLSVDDMESYVIWSNPAGPHIFSAWRDGFGDCTTGNGNDTGSVLTENASPVLGGVQSMKYDFDNDGTVYSPCTMGLVTGRHLYSRIEAQTATLPSGIGSDWTIEGVKALSIPFHGQAGNATTESLWVQLQDGAKGYGEKVFYGTYEGESLDDFDEESWHEWNIDLADFDVDLNDVVSIVIGIGNEDQTGAHGSGTLFLDELRLYAPTCVPSHRSAAFAKVDYAPKGNPDCVVNYKELEVMAGEWLVEVTYPGTGNLVGWWKLDDATGATAQDSSGYGNPGTLMSMNPGSDWVTGRIGGALHFDGSDDYVDCGNNESLQITGTEIGIAAWAKWDTAEDYSAIAMKTSTGDWVDGYGLYVNSGSVDFYVSYYDNGASKPFAGDGEWHHVVGTYDGSNVRVWLDGVEGTSRSYTGSIGNADHSFEIGRGADDSYNFSGALDDVRVYNVALTDADILGLLGFRTDLNEDMKIDFKDFAVLGDRFLDEEMFP